MIQSRSSDPMQATFRALADPTRRQIIGLLGDDPQTVAQVAGQFDITRAAVKKHLVVLEEGGIVRSEPRGRETYNHLNPEGLRQATLWLAQFERFWDTRLGALRDAVARETRDGDDT